MAATIIAIITLFVAVAAASWLLGADKEKDNYGRNQNLVSPALFSTSMMVFIAIVLDGFRG